MRSHETLPLPLIRTWVTFPEKAEKSLTFLETKNREAWTQVGANLPGKESQEFYFDAMTAASYSPGSAPLGIQGTY